MTNVRIGIQTGNFSQPNPGNAAFQVFDNNIIQARRRGIFHNLQYGTASTITLSNNNITALTNSNETIWDGILLSSLSVPSTSTINTINGIGVTIPSEGYAVWNVASSGPASISGGSVTNVTNGVFANNWEGYFNSNAPDGAYATISGLVINPLSTGTGIRLHDHPGSTHANVQLTIGSGVTVTGGAKGVVVEGGSAKVISPVGNLALASQTGKYIELIDNANNIDATTITFDTKLGSTMSLAELFATEDKIDHKIDLASLGFVTVNANNDYVTGNSFVTPNTTPSIQRGIDAASANFTVNIQDGLYKESNINVDKALNILGQSRSGVILGPSVTDGHLNAAFTDASQAFIVKSSGVNIQKMTIDGNANPALSGSFHFRNGVITDQGANYNNITASDVTFKNIYRRGVCIYTKDGHSSGMNVSSNSFNNIGNGLSFESGSAIMVFDADASITTNTITNCGNGIGTNYLTTGANSGVFTITDNMISVDAVQGIGLDISGLKGGSTVSNNTITQGQYGIVPEYTYNAGTTPVTISNNPVSGVKYGIYLYALDDFLKVVNNSITSPSSYSGSRGIYFANTYAGETPGAISKAQMEANTISGYEIGVDLGLNGTGTLQANTISGNGTGVLISGGGKLNSCLNNFIWNNTADGISVAADAGTIGLINDNDLSGNGGKAINNLSLSTLNATCNWYGTNTVSGVAAASSGLVTNSPWLVDGTDYASPVLPGFQPVPGSCSGMANIYVNDASTSGDGFTGATGNDATGNGTASAPFATITKAVSIAMAGANVYVDAGTYQEQVQVGKSLNIIGWDRSSTIIKAPAILHDVSNANYPNHHPIIYAYGAGNTIAIDKVTVDGDGGRSIDKFMGVYYFAANGTFSNSRITGIRDALFSGNQRGLAFVANHQYDISLDQTVTVTNNIIDDYQKGGIIINELNTHGIVSGNTVTGKNIAGVTAQNGIQFGYGAYGEITGNTVTNNIWNAVEHPHTWTAAGILLAGVGVDAFNASTGKITTIGGNILNGNENALSSGKGGSGYDSNLGLVINANTFSNNKIHVGLDDAGSTTPNVSDVYDKRVDNPVKPNWVYGCVQYGIDEATAGNTLNASAGTFIENVIVHTPVTVNGNGVANTFVIPVLSAPNPGGGGSLPPGASNIFLVQANDVTIQNLTADGNNPSLTSSLSSNGVDVDARNGIITNHALGVYNNLNINHVTVKNIYLRGMYASSGGSFNFHDNTVTNVGGEASSIAMFNFGGAGAFTNNTVSDANDAISSNHSSGTTYSGNTVTNSGSGIHTDNQGDGGGTADVIENNTISDSPANGYGIFVFAPYKNVLVQQNTITNVEVGLTCAGSYAPGTMPVFTQNTVDGQMKANSIGVYSTTEIWGYTSGNQNVVFTNNFIRNNVKGFLIASELGFTNTTTANSNSVTGNTTGVKLVNDYNETPPTGSFSLNMTCNWWGSACSASFSSLIDPSVVYSPWLPADGDGVGVGFQPTATCTNTNPVATLTGGSSVCINSAGNVYTTESGMNNYSWTIVGGTITSGGGTINNTATVTWNTSGSQSISVNYTNTYGCSPSGPAVLNVTVNPLPDAATAITGSASFVQGTSGIAYSVGTITNATSYSWSYTGTGVTINGTGNSVTLDFAPTATDGDLTVKGHNDCGDGVVSSSLHLSGNKTLNITNIMLEGLYDGAGTMRQAQNASGPQWSAGIADHITIELHSATNYATKIYFATDVELSTSGTATITLSGAYNGLYYITIRHRNSIETTTASAVSFASSNISQSFGAKTNVFGNNLGVSTDGHYLIYAGDVDQDGLVDGGGDMIIVDNSSTDILIGYNAADVNGDGLVDSSDMNIVDNNSTAKVQVHIP